MNELINPGKFQPAVRKVRPMYRPKYYLAGLVIGGQVRVPLHAKHRKTFTEALNHSNRLLAYLQVRYERELARMVGEVQA